MADFFANLRLRFSEQSFIRAADHFTSIDDFDAALQAASSAARDCAPNTAFVLFVLDGVTFFGRVRLDCDRHGWTAHVLELCTQLVAAPKLDTHSGFANLTRSRLHLALAHGHLAATIARATEIARRQRKSSPSQ